MRAREIEKHEAVHVRCIHSPAEDGWPKGCSFTLRETKETLRLGYFPDGAVLYFERRKYTVHGTEAIAVDGTHL